MTIESYLGFVALAVVVIVAPGADFAITARNTLAGGFHRGWATATGITVSNLIQGVSAAAGLGAVIVASEPLFQAIKWAGILYLTYLAFQAFGSAWRGQYTTDDAKRDGSGVRRGFQQGFLTNITNPKVLVFYLAVMPQFMTPHAPLWALGLLAFTHALISMAYLFVLVVLLSKAQPWLSRRVVRRALDVLTGSALAALGIRLAAE